MTDTAAKPAPVYTVWERPRYEDYSTEVWTGAEFAQALQVVVDRLGRDAVTPLDAPNVAALHRCGTPVSAFVATDADGEQRTVFITR